VENAALPRLGVLISGRGSNLQAIIDAIVDGRLRAMIAIVISNVPDAPGLERARAAGNDTLAMPHQDWPSRAAYDRALAEALTARRVDLICLAGFMRLLTAPFLDRFPHHVLNVHPSLLPAFPGVDAQQQALAHGVKVAGATVHFVTPELDAGPIIRQAAVPVLPGDTPESLSARILIEEHRLYPLAIADVLRGRWQVDGRRFFEDAPTVHTSELDPP
jgi:phosphoribosylglycinamide formyltransferase-1